VNLNLNLALNLADLNPGQAEFLANHDWATLFAGGFGAGKSTILGIKALDQVSRNPGTPGLLLAQTRGALKATTWGKIKRLLQAALPRRLVPKWHDPNEESYVDFPNGARVYLRSAHNVNSFADLDVGWVCGDEARLWTREALNVSLARARIKCPYPGRYYASTPSMGVLDEEFNQGRANRTLITAPTRENLHNLQADYEENLRLSYSARMQASIIDGLFTILEGAVYESLIPRLDSPNIMDYDHDRWRDKKTYLAIDPGFRRSSWLWIRELDPTSWVVFHQMQADNTPVSACVQRVNEINMARKWRIDEAWVDPAADARDQVEGQTIVNAIAQLDFRMGRRIGRPWDRYRAIPWGVEKVRVMLGDVDTGRPIRLFFSRSLFESEKGRPRGVIKSLSSYSYPEVKDGRPVTDLPVKDGAYDHACDALRYWVIGMWLSNPQLRRLDQQIGKRPGYRLD
jgi:hypothetical protein